VQTGWRLGPGVTEGEKIKVRVIHRIIIFLHYSKIMDWGCVLYTSAYYIRDFTVFSVVDCYILRIQKCHIDGDESGICNDCAAESSVCELVTSTTLVPVKVVVGVWVLKARTLLRCIHKCCKISEKWPCVQLPPVDVDCVRYKTLESACCSSSSLLWQLFGLSDLAVGWLNLALGTVFDSCSYACLALCSFQCRRTLSSFRPVLACL